VIAQGRTYDVIIRNGRVLDGSGNPWVKADVGIIGDRIVTVGKIPEKAITKQTIDATGLLIAPGFIDMLGQSEISLLIDPRGESKLTQGVTTEITGEGESVAPLNNNLIADQKDFTDHFKLKIDWISVDGYLKRLEKSGTALNLGTYVGATQLREAVIGKADRAPTAAEMDEMKSMADDAMSEGAFGLSSSLIYAPAFYAKTNELIELAKVVAKHGGIYATHMRNEGDHENEALDEVFRISKEANIPVEIFHLKVAGAKNWGKMQSIIDRISKARVEGLDITADQYPYVAAATSLGASIPPKYHDGGDAEFVKRLQDPEQRAKIRADLTSTGDQDFENMWRGVQGAKGVLIASVLDPALREYEGKTIEQIAQWKQKDAIDAMLDLIVADKNNTGAVYFLMYEDDVRLAMKQVWLSVGTDYNEVSTTGPLSESKSHPRAWGSFTRILGKYVREEKLLTLPDAIRKMTSLPAQRMGLERRGWIRPDYFADITIFNGGTVLDKATFEVPSQPSVGIEYVLVNGVMEVEKGKLTGKLAGRPLRGPGYSARAISPNGLHVPGALKGFVTGLDGYPLLRTKLTLQDNSGVKLAETNTTGLEAKFEMVYEKPCNDCMLIAERDGFKSEMRKVDYNGSNALFFSFILKPVKLKVKH